MFKACAVEMGDPNQDPWGDPAEAYYCKVFCFYLFSFYFIHLNFSFRGRNVIAINMKDLKVRNAVSLDQQ